MGIDVSRKGVEWSVVNGDENMDNGMGIEAADSVVRLLEDGD